MRAAYRRAAQWVREFVTCDFVSDRRYNCVPGAGHLREMYVHISWSWIHRSRTMLLNLRHCLFSSPSYLIVSTDIERCMVNV